MRPKAMQARRRLSPMGAPTLSRRPIVNFALVLALEKVALDAMGGPGQHQPCRRRAEQDHAYDEDAQFKASDCFNQAAMVTEESRAGFTA